MLLLYRLGFSLYFANASFAKYKPQPPNIPQSENNIETPFNINTRLSSAKPIKELESELNITIFDRNSKGIVITPEGEKLIIYGKKILKQINDLETSFSDNVILYLDSNIATVYEKEIALFIINKRIQDLGNYKELDNHNKDC